MTQQYHNPVMLNECLEGLQVRPDGTYVDVTFGGGGHSKAILARLTDGKIYVFDQDQAAEVNVPDDDRITFINENFRHLKRFLRLLKGVPVDGILADLGVSSHQIDTAERGFSIRFEGDLDMRMSSSSELTAKDIVNSYSADDLQRIFSIYGEIENSKTLAKAIVAARAGENISTTQQLVHVIEPVIRGKRNQYLARVFQAIRIEVNGEMEALKEMLEQSAEVLKDGGRLVVISYHSLEDRLVKNYMKRGSFSGELVKDFYGQQLKPFKTVNSKPILPTEEEVEQNPRARSAKLRIAEKI